MYECTVYVEIFQAKNSRGSERIFADQDFLIYGVLKFHELNFHGLLGSAKIALLENLDVYVARS